MNFFIKFWYRFKYKTSRQALQTIIDDADKATESYQQSIVKAEKTMNALLKHREELYKNEAEAKALSFNLGKLIN